MFGGPFLLPGILVRIMWFRPGSLHFQGRMRAIRNVISSPGVARNPVTEGPQTTLQLRRFRAETGTLNPASTFSVNRHGAKKNTFLPSLDT